jgi:Polysaccharide lyase
MFPDGRIGIGNTGVAASSADGRAYHFFMAATDYPGCYEGRSEIAQGDWTPPGQTQANAFYPGDNEWIAWEAYFPSDYPLDSSNNPTGNGGGFIQFHQNGGCNTPPINLGIAPGTNTWKGGQIGIQATDAPTDCPVNYSNQIWRDNVAPSPILHNQWYRFMVHADFEDTATGFYDVYVDMNDGKGMQLIFSSPRNIYTLYSNALPSHLRIGLTNDSSQANSSNEDLYIAGLTVATNQAAAQANAFGSTGP